MIISRISQLTGKTHTMDLPVTIQEMARYKAGWLLQDAFPNLAPPLREFIRTGITPDEWTTHIGVPQPEANDE
jgi:hypothetical protein